MPKKLNCDQNDQADHGCEVCKNCNKLRSPYEVLKYIQPLQPIESDTIYRTSYLPIHPCSAHDFRPAPIIHKDSVQKNTGDFEKETVASLSYPGHRCVSPPKAILPIAGHLVGDCIFFDETTQKHDFVVVPKCCKKRDPIIPVGNILGPCGGMEKETTNKLSFMPIDVLLTPPPKPLKPIQNHERPSVPMESDTIQKLSYIPVCLPPKEEYPWAKKKSFCMLSEPMEKETTYKLSFFQNCAPRRETPIYPKSCLKMLGDGQFYNDWTKYKASYIPTYGGRRPPLIKHSSNIKLSSDPFKKDTVYKMSVPGHCNKSRSKPILPPSSSLRLTGPLEKDTTHKKSYLSNYQSRRKLKIPKDSMMKASGSFKKNTVAKLSYMPQDMKNFERAKPIVPTSSYHKPDGPTSHETTQKLSFMPVCYQPKQRPTVPRSNYQRPEGPMSNETVQRTSLMPPGKFVSVAGSSCCEVCKNCKKLCSPYEVLKYIQPPRAESIKPVSQYQRPEGPIESDTIYRKSYLPIHPCSAHDLRQAPIIHKDSVQKNTGDFEKETVTSLSYPGHRCVSPPKPILPIAGNLFGDGIFFDETTQKHDFVPKCCKKRDPIIPVGNILGPCGRMEKETTNKLSFMPIDVLLTPPPKPLKPIQNHERPSVPMESDTIQKLSYIPVCLPPKEEYPWAKKKSFCMPNEPMEKETTYKLSFFENCAPRRETPIYPESCLKMLGDGQFYDDRTTYKASYIPIYGGRRPSLIKHSSNIKLSSDPFGKDTVYKMSFPGHCNKSRFMPILPPSSSLRLTGPLEKDTTQKMSYLWSYQPRRKLKIPKDSIMKASGSFENNTVAKLSYMPQDMKNFERAKPIVPKSSYHKPDGPTSYETTQKLSFMPVCYQPKQRPIVPRSSFQRPEGPMSNETVQRTSFMPPGIFVSVAGFCCCDYVRRQKIYEMSYPRAGIEN